MLNQTAEQLFHYFKARNLSGLQGIRHHIDKQELRAGTIKLLSDIADHLAALGFDGKSKPLTEAYREMLLELATLVGPLGVLMRCQKGSGIVCDKELARCLLNQLPGHLDGIVIEQIEPALMHSNFGVGMLLVRFYLHKLPSGRKPERKLTAMELYGAFDALSECVAFQAQGHDELATIEVMRLLVETGYVHNILYKAQAGHFAPSQRFYDALNVLQPSEQQFLKQFHARKKA